MNHLILLLLCVPLLSSAKCFNIQNDNNNNHKRKLRNDTSIDANNNDHYSHYGSNNNATADGDDIIHQLTLGHFHLIMLPTYAPLKKWDVSRLLTKLEYRMDEYMKAISLSNEYLYVSLKLMKIQESILQNTIMMDNHKDNNNNDDGVRLRALAQSSYNGATVLYLDGIAMYFNGKLHPSKKEIKNLLNQSVLFNNDQRLFDSPPLSYITEVKLLWDDETDVPTRSPITITTPYPTTSSPIVRSTPPPTSSPVISRPITTNRPERSHPITSNPTSHPTSSRPTTSHPITSIPTTTSSSTPKLLPSNNEKFTITREQKEEQKQVKKSKAETIVKIFFSLSMGFCFLAFLAFFRQKRKRQRRQRLDNELVGLSVYDGSYPIGPTPMVSVPSSPLEGGTRDDVSDITPPSSVSSTSLVYSESIPSVRGGGNNDLGLFTDDNNNDILVDSDDDDDDDSIGFLDIVGKNGLDPLAPPAYISSSEDSLSTFGLNSIT